MDPQIISWLISLIAGSAGGNVIGALLKNRNLGPMLNTILGLVGGGNVANGGLSAIIGALLPLIVSFLKKPAA